jgi:predicted TIM-barrel fold metal-dependent hydrolase
MSDDLAVDEMMAAAAKKYWESDGWKAGGEIREIDYAAATAPSPLLAGIKIVDCDTHITEAPDLFTSRAPARFKDKVPFVRREPDGADHWFVGNRDFGSLGGNVVRKDKHKLLGRLAFPTIDEGTKGAWDTKARLEAMDELGIYAQICYHNSGVTQAGSLMSLGNNDLAIEILKMYNDAGIQRQHESGQRMFTMAHLPIWDKAAMEAEARRCVDMGLKGFVLPDTPERLGIPDYNDDYWTPFLELCNDTGTPLNFHLNAAIDPSGLTWKSFDFEQRLAVVATMYSIGNASTLGNWMVSGRLDRHRKLKIGMIESGMGWVPFAIEALEHQFNEMMPKNVKKLSRRPWEYFHDHFVCTYWFEKVGPKLLLETVGVDNVLFETDFPHPTSLYPGVQAHLVATLGDYDAVVRKKVLQTNAAKFYNLPF